MISIDGQDLSAGASVVAWLRDAGAANRDEISPAIRLQPALETASPADRSQSLVALAEALATASDSFRLHLMYAIQGFDDEALADALVAHLEPEPAEWLAHEHPVGGSVLARPFLNCLAHGPGVTDDRLVVGLRRMAAQYDLGDKALAHFVTFHAADHGLELLSEHLVASKSLTEQLAKRFGGRFARDAPTELPALASLLLGYDRAIREQFLAGAARRLDDPESAELARALGL